MGTLLAIEGISGSGKSSLSQKICKEFEKHSIPCSEFGGFNISEHSTELTKFCNNIIRQKRFIGLPFASESHLLLSEILLDIEMNVKKKLMNDEVVIYENYFDSILIYQSSVINTLNISDDKKNKLQEYLRKTINLTKDYFNIPKPDIIIFLNCDVGICNARIIKRDNLPITKQQIRLQYEIQNKYLEYYCEKKNVMYCDGESLHDKEIIDKLVLYIKERRGFIK